jgi:hypothetical protein
MQDLLSQLRDISGLDAIGWWPPAPGWWAVMALLLVILTGVYFYRRYQVRKAAGWQAEAESMFAGLRAETDGKKKAATLSDLLRRLAIRHHDRDACAGLEGQAWLEWLSMNDPEGFDWQKEARIIIEAPYAPDGSVAGNDMELLITAAERWVE